MSILCDHLIEETVEIQREGEWEGPSWVESDETGPGLSKCAGLEPMKWEELERESFEADLLMENG